MRLTRGEAWWLLRRRAGMTQSAWAGVAGVSEDRLRRWEADAEEPAVPGPFRNGGRVEPLTHGEFSALARRRTGWTLPELARRLGTSRQTLWKREHDRTGSARELAEWWAPGYPAAEAPAPLRIGAPRR
jgi:transcriptional regulator with XRE-family HTH domain